MFTAMLKSSQQKMRADLAEKSEGTFICESCREEVILRQGLVREEHFAHKTGAVCNYAGESINHLKMKKAIYNRFMHYLGGKVKSIELEKHLGDVRPDVYVEGNKLNIAIEVQASALTAEQIIYRTQHYANKNIYVLWVLPFDRHRFIRFNPKLGKEVPVAFRVKEYERVISYMYFKNIVFWDIDGFMTRDFIVAKIEDTFTDSVEFYEKGTGEHKYFEPRKLKTLKILGQTLINVKLKDLKPTFAGPFEMPRGEYTLPARKIMTYDWRKPIPDQKKISSVT